MISWKVKFTLVVVLILALLIPLTTPVLGSTNVAFTHEPDSYNVQSGSFTMTYELTGDTSSNGGSVCVSYDYFVFNAKAGQTLQGHAASDGKMMYYTILQSPIGLHLFQNSNCAGGYWPNQGFTGATTMTWVAPADGQYVLIFLTAGFYGGKVSFTVQTT